MKRIALIVTGLIAATLAVWLLIGAIADRRYARRPYETEAFDTPTFSVQIPKGWRRPDYANPRTGTRFFTTSTNARDRDDPYFVYGHLSISDEGLETADAVVDEWRKGGEYEGPTGKVKFGEIEAVGWTSIMGFGDVAGDASTFVFTGNNGHTYAAHYLMARAGRYRKRQEYVFQRIIASMKFKPDSAKTSSPRR